MQAGSSLLYLNRSPGKAAQALSSDSLQAVCGADTAPQVSILHVSNVDMSPAHGGKSRSVLTVWAESKSVCTAVCWFFLSWMFLSPWYMSTFSLCCNYFSSVKQFPEGFWQSLCLSFPREALARTFPEEQGKEERSLSQEVGLCHTLRAFFFFFQTNIPWKQHVHLASAHPHAISTIPALFKWIHGSTLKVFKMWQTEKRRDIAGLFPIPWDVETANIW